jgi:hypothetical protein
MDREALSIPEEWAVHVPMRATDVRVATPEFVFSRGGGSGGAIVRPRISPDHLEGAVERARAVGREHDVPDLTWWCGKHGEPADLADRLLERGLVPEPDEPILLTLALTRPPDGSPTTEVRRVDDLDGYLAALEIDWESFGTPVSEREQRRQRAVDDWPGIRDAGVVVHHLAYAGGEPVAYSRTVFLRHAALLLGGGTLAAARGHGAYRSLIHRRWQEAVERGTPALVVGAGAMSGPILERLGFERHGEIRLLVDRL